MPAGGVRSGSEFAIGNVIENVTSRDRSNPASILA